MPEIRPAIFKDVGAILKAKGISYEKANQKQIILQAWGFEIVLNPSGTWYINDTSGG